MGPPLRERLGWRISREAHSPVLDGGAAMARAGFWLGSAGALVAVLALVLPHSSEVDEAGVAAAGALAMSIALLALIGFDSLPRWAFHAGTVAGGVAATLATYFWGDGSLIGPVPYLFPAFFAFTFFPVPAALIHLALIGAMFAIELALRDPGYAAVAEWAVTVGSLAGTGLLLAFVRDGLGRRISTLAVAALRDPLTGLLNRKGFEDAFDVELERARRTEQSMSVIVGDLDGFGEAVNDRLGRPAGDEALRQVGLLLESTKRSWDVAARVGGEEFALLAPDTDEHGAYILAERARAAIEETFEGPDWAPLTASFGVVSFPLHGQTGAALLQAADQALYAAKRLGRNRSVISSAEVPGILGRGPRRRDEGHVELASLLSLAEALDVRDAGSASHCQRAGRYAELIARELGLPPAEVERIRIAGILHDVGRVGVPDELLAKAGPLSEQEWRWMRAHPDVGARMLQTTDYADIGEWIGAHHERPDGTGYPAGRRAGEVPLEAGILAVADAYEAMTARRPYRTALDPEAAAEELRRGAGRQFDQRVVDALLRVV